MHNIDTEIAAISRHDTAKLFEGNCSNEAADRLAFHVTKRGFDIFVGLCLLPLLFLTGLALLVLNPFLNPGPLVFSQPRMGRGCKAFRTIKFRSMLPARHISRRADDPLEIDRITKLGAFLREARIDELPQIICVLRGEMSLIGPRPDYFHHARHYLRVIPGYRERYAVRPGISGLAQTELGYANGIEATVAKTRADLHYIQNAGFRLDARIFWRTLVTIIKCLGS